MERNLENAIEFFSGEKTATLSLTNKRFVNRLKRLFESEHGEEMLRFTENSDGSVYCVVPLRWIRISPPRKMTDEEKLALAERMNGNKDN